MSNAERAILSQRARALARPIGTDAVADPADLLDVVLVEIDGATIALTSKAILSVSRAQNVTPLPRATPPAAALMGWRGRPLTVLSLHHALAPEPAKQLVVVLGAGGRAIGALLVDDVDDAITLDRRDLTPAPTGALSHYALGVTSGAMLVLDAELILKSLRTPS